MNFIDVLIQILTKLQNFSYLLVFLISFVESLAFVGLFIPGTIFNVFIGFLAGKGMFDIYDLFGFAFAGAILGDGISFYLGKRAKKLFRPDNRIFKSNYLTKGEEFFKKHGPKSIFLGRFIGPIRPIIPFVAGMFEMKTKKFIFWNILSAFAWATFYLFLGYFFGQTWQIIAAWSSRTGIFVLVLLLFLLLFYLLKKLILTEGKRLFLFCKSIFFSIIQGVTKNPEVINLIKNYPLIFRFLNHRLDRTKFTGLPLTLFALLFIYIFSLLFGITRAILKTAPIFEADIRIENLLFVFRYPGISRVFAWITILGQWQFCISVIIIASLLLYFWRKKEYILPFWLTILGNEIFVYFGKLLFHRPRPEGLGSYLEDSFAFPSGHSALAVVLYGFIVYFLWRNFKSWKNKMNIAFLGFLIMIAIGFSRLYLGVHYLSDVLGGYLLGLLWLIIGINLIEWLKLKKQKGKFEATAKLKIFTGFLLILQILSYLAFGFLYKPVIKIEDPKISIQQISGDLTDLFLKNNLAKYTETIDSTKQEPISFIIIAQDDKSLLNAFKKADWLLAEKVSINSIFKIAETAILNQGYDTAPMTPSFWDANIHNFGFQKPTQSNTVRQRHHVRFWQTNYKTAEGKNIYVGTASLDIGIKWLVVHTINPNIDSERELIFQDLQSAQVIKNYQLTQFVDPLLGKNFAGDQFFTDGKIYILELK